MAVQDAIDRLEAWRDDAAYKLRTCEPRYEEQYQNQRDNYQAVIDMLTDKTAREQGYIVKGHRVARLFMEQRETCSGSISRAQPADIAFAAAALQHNQGQTAVLEFCDYLQSKE